MGIIAPILPLFTETFSASAFSIGLVFSAFPLSRTIIAPWIGRISDRVGRKRIILIGLCSYGVVSLLYVLVTSLWQIGALRFVQGAGAVMVAPIAQAYVGDLTPRGKEGRYISLFYSSMFIGMALGPVIGGGLTELWSYGAAFLAMGALSLMALLFVAVVLPSKDIRVQPQEKASAMGRGFWDLVRSDAVMAQSAYWMTRGFWRQGFNTFYPLFAASVLRADEATIGLVLTVHLLAGGLLQVPLGWLADRYSRFPQIILGSALAPLTMVPLLFVRQTWVVMVLVFLMGAFGALSRASMLAMRVEIGREHGMGAMAGLQSGALGAGQMLGPLVCGFAVDRIGARGVFPLGAAVGVAGTLLTAMWLRRSNGSP